MSLRTIRADLHNHLKTRANVADDFDLDKVIELGQKKLGLGGILGIVNFADTRYEQIHDLPGAERKDLGCGFYVPRKDVLVVKGEEVPTKEGHVLVFGIERNKHITLGRSLQDTIKEVKDQNGIIIIDHPFMRGWGGIGPYLEKHEQHLEDIDAIEIFNGEATVANIPFMLNPNREALEFYRKKKEHFPHLGALTTSDGHSAAEVGRSYTKIQMPQNYDAVFLGATISTESLIGMMRGALRSATPEDGVGQSAKWRALLHAGVVIWDHIRKS
ncbi:MAG: hypothetical protein Q8L34_04575 [Candidatus Woesearchaeota archaeon]|nr:hypothetical protein [Candidatus Woesearchaeota archaeon]